MKFIALVKQVPDTKDQRFQENFSILREGLDLICNPYDEYAIEEAVRLKERFGGEAIALSMGKQTAMDLLRFAVSVGIDKAILLSDPIFMGSDLLGTAMILSQALRKNMPFDIILTGKQSSDGENGVVSSAIAELLDLPFVMDVRRIVEIKDGKVLVEQMVMGGYYMIEVQLPVVVGVLKEINEPRLPSLKGKMLAKNAQIPVWSVKDIEVMPNMIGSGGARTKVVGAQDPLKKEGVKIFSGAAEEAATQLVNELLERKLI